MAQIWVNNALVQDDRPHIPVRDRGFLLGDGLFETLRVQNGSIRNLEAHLARARHGAQVLGLTLPAGLCGALEAVLKADELKQGSMRFTLTRGCGGRGLDYPETVTPALVVTATSHAPLVSPVKVRLTPHLRRDEISPLSRVKVLGYLTSILARNAAREQGDDDALLPNTCGKIACAAVASILVWDGEEWTTPPLDDGGLAGTARAQLLEAGIVRERSWGVTERSGIQAMMLVNALSARPVTHIDGRALAWPLAACDSAARIGSVLDLALQV